MLSHFVDNAVFYEALLALIAIGLGVAWWKTRNRRWLLSCGIPLALMIILVVLTFVVDTDRKQIARNVDSMRDAINAGNAAEAAKYFDENVTIDTRNGKFTMSNKYLEKMAKGTMGAYQVKQVETGRVEVEELSGAKAMAKFMVRDADNPGQMGWCRMEFVRTPNGKWLVKWMTVESYIGGQ